MVVEVAKSRRSTCQIKGLTGKAWLNGHRSLVVGIKGNGRYIVEVNFSGDEGDERGVALQWRRAVELAPAPSVPSTSPRPKLRAAAGPLRAVARATRA